MRPKFAVLISHLDTYLKAYEAGVRPLPGIATADARESFLEQCVDSIRRVDFVKIAIRRRLIHPSRADPTSGNFDPLRAALYHSANGNIEEAYWLTFLSTHFGKHGKTGWSLVRDIYAALGSSQNWTWSRTSTDVPGFRKWLESVKATLTSTARGKRGFGNHRKYESLDAYSAAGTGNVIATYVAWVTASGSQAAIFNNALMAAGGDPREAFDAIYQSMIKSVKRFGRTGAFDFLTMVGKLGLAPIEPGSTYMDNATGPLTGARLLFGDATARPGMLEQRLVDLDEYLGVGMQVLEDALCNWQKSPTKYVAFRG